MSLWLAAALAMATPQQPLEARLAEAAHAIEAGRLVQAKAMISAAVSAGATGPKVERLLADLAFARGDNERALAGYQSLLLVNHDDARLVENAGIAALRLGRLDEAAGLLERATGFANASWKAWAARGVLADFRQDWPAADEAYGRAAALAPGRAEISNNIGWSLLLRGEWELAAAELERAAAIDPRSPVIAANLELARAATMAGLPARREGENDEQWAARLNDAGVIAAAQGDSARAVAAFTQAIETRSQYYTRAANNLARIEGAR